MRMQFWVQNHQKKLGRIVHLQLIKSGKRFNKNMIFIVNVLFSFLTLFDKPDVNVFNAPLTSSRLPITVLLLPSQSLLDKPETKELLVVFAELSLPSKVV